MDVRHVLDSSHLPSWILDFKISPKPLKNHEEKKQKRYENFEVFEKMP